jgi:hypothetical protein
LVTPPLNFLAEHPPAAVMRLTIASISRLSDEACKGSGRVMAVSQCLIEHPARS